MNVLVHRASLLSPPIAPLPKEALHVNKKLDSVKSKRNQLRVAFTDGVTGTFDAVIGADGIFGSVRKHVLRDRASDHATTPAGFMDSIYPVPFAKAQEELGHQFFTEHRQYGQCGDGVFIMHDALDDGETVQSNRNSQTTEAGR